MKRLGVGGHRPLEFVKKQVVGRRGVAPPTSTLDNLSSLRASEWVVRSVQWSGKNVQMAQVFDVGWEEKPFL